MQTLVDQSVRPTVAPHPLDEARAQLRTAVDALGYDEGTYGMIVF